MDVECEVVISGIGGVFPSTINIDDFRDLLMENISLCDPAKWVHGELDCCDVINYLPPVHNLFDASFFGVHRLQTKYMDPMARIFMESTLEALIDAGVNPVEIRGKNIAVLLGSTISETDGFMFEPISSGFGVTGQARAMLPNRVSYWLNLNGTSAAMDSTWTSGINVIEQAVKFIKSGQCDSVIVGTSSMVLSAALSWSLRQQGMTSEDGKTRAFDEKADGYARSEGVVVLYIQRADLARRSYATILYANVTYNGLRSGLLSSIDVNGLKEFLESCYQKSGVDPNDVQYLEAYGSGIKKIDEAEMKAIEQVLCKNRKDPLQVGSVKSNVGHSEASSAMLSLLKIIFAMESGIIPATVNYDTPNANIPALVNGKVEIVTKNKEWNGGIAAVNAIGLSSSYGHLIIRSNTLPRKRYVTNLPPLTVFSTRTKEGIDKIIDTIRSKPIDMEFLRLSHEVFSSNIPGHIYRGYVLQGSNEKSVCEYFAGVKRPIWFAYSGMGSQWHTMGRDLLEVPIFAEAINKCHATLEPKGVDLLKIITDNDPDIFENILHSFVGIAAIQIGLTDILHAMGITPDGLIGHSVGELGCAYADGCLSAEQMILSAYYRGKASLDAELIVGMMAAIGMGYKELKAFCPPTIDLACHNGSGSCTVSGPAEDIKKFVTALQGRGIFAKLVNVSNIAYHSRYIRPAAPLLLKFLKEIIQDPKARSSKWFSTSIPESEWTNGLAKTASAEYLTNNLLSSVLFEEVLPKIPSNAVVIEIAPHGLLQAILKRSLNSDCLNVSLTKRNSNGLDYLFNALGTLYLSGIEFNLSVLYPQVSFPVSRGTRSLCSFMHWEHGEEWENYAIDTKSYAQTEINILITINSEEFKDFIDYQIDGKMFIPPAAYLDFVCNFFRKTKPSGHITLENIVFKNSVELSLKGSTSLTIMIHQASGYFEVSEGHTNIVTGIIRIPEQHVPLVNSVTENNKRSYKINSTEFYKEMNDRGYCFNGVYKGVSSVNFTENESISHVFWNNNMIAFISLMMQIHTFHAGESKQNILMPSFIQRLEISFDDIPKQEQDVIVSYNYTSGVIKTSGIQLIGMQAVPFKIMKRNLIIDLLTFMEHFNENLEIQNGIDLCMKIVIENSDCTNNTLAITELKTKKHTTYSDLVRNSLKQYSFLQTRINTLDNISSNAIFNSSLIILNKLTENLSSLFYNFENFLLVCLPNTEELTVNKENMMIVKFKVDGNCFYLLRKARASSVDIVNVTSNKLTCSDIEMKTETWVSQLYSVVNNAKSDLNRRIFIVSRIVPLEGIENFSKELRQVPEFRRVRMIFTLDKNVPECTPDAKFYQHVFRQDLSLSVFKDGAWGTYVTFSKLCNSSKEQNHNANIISTLSNEFITKYNVSCVSIHAKDLTYDSSNDANYEIGILGYSSVNILGQRVMGVARSYSNGCEVEPDPDLVWPVPERWSSSDAATVPYAYAMAYHMLFEVAQLTEGESVLVHCGCSAVGQAALQLAANHACNIYTTVATEKQRSFLLSSIPQLEDAKIMSSEDCNFEIQIMSLTQGKGVRVIINNLPGIRLEASKRCLGWFGRFIQVGAADLEEHATTGMNVFIKSSAFYGVTSDTIYKNPGSTKKLKLHIENGLSDGIVRPLGKTIFQEVKIDSILRHLNSSQCLGAAILNVRSENNSKRTIVNSKLHFKCNKNGSYLVYGGLFDKWINVVEWLVARGAQDIIVATDREYSQSFNHRRLDLLKQNYRASIILTSQNASSPESANNLIRDADLLGPIIDIFVLGMEEKNSKFNFDHIYNIDVALNTIESKARLVCFLGEKEDKPIERINYLPVFNIMWRETYNLLDVLNSLDSVLSNKENGYVFVKSEVETSEPKLVKKDECLFLPNTLKTLKQIGQNMSTEINFVQMMSKSSKMAQEIPPVFIFPGLSGHHCPYLKKFVGQFLYPVYCLDLASTNLKKESMLLIAKKILEIYKSNVCNVIGYSWGGLLAIEVTKELEREGVNVNLQLIDAAPKTMRDLSSALTELRTLDIELLKQLVKIDDSESLPDALKSLTSSGHYSKDYQCILNSLKILKDRIDFSSFYTPSSFKTAGEATLFRPESGKERDTCGLMEHCKHVEVNIISGDHRTMLENTTLIDHINNCILVCFT